jgi:anti-sigma factor RsiW
MNHLTDEQLRSLVEGLLDTPDEKEVGMHLDRCSECARRLQREARFELLLHEAAQKSSLGGRMRKAGWFLAAAAAFVLAVAGLALTRRFDRMPVAAEPHFPVESSASRQPVTTQGGLAENLPAPLRQPGLHAPQFESSPVTRSGLEVW